MKKFLISLIFVFILSAIFAISASALNFEYEYFENGVSKGKIIYTTNDMPYGEVCIGNNQNNTSISDVVIPETVYDESGNAYTVTAILNTAFFENQTITKISFPKTLYAIDSEEGGGIFERCPLLEEIYFHPEAPIDHLTTHAFKQCPKLTTVILSDNIKVIPDWAFRECPELSLVHLPARLERLGDWGSSDAAKGVFTRCPKLKFDSDIMPKTLKYLNGQLFQGCDKLNETLIFSAEDMEFDWGYMFQGSGTKRIVILGSVKKLNIFSSCSVTHFYFAKQTPESVRAASGTYSNGGGNVYFCGYEGGKMKETEGWRVFSSSWNIDDFVNSLSTMAADKHISITETREVNCMHTGGTYTYTCCGDETYTGTDDYEEKSAHDYVEFASYPNGFDSAGYKCQRCTVCQDEIDIVPLDPIFTAKGYSIDVADGSTVISGYLINIEALQEYERITGRELKYGVLVINARDNMGDLNFINDGERMVFQYNGNAIQARFNNADYSYEAFNIRIQGYEPENSVHQSLKLVASIYVFDGKDIWFVQRQSDIYESKTVGVKYVYCKQRLNMIAMQNLFNYASEQTPQP